MKQLFKDHSVIRRLNSQLVLHFRKLIILYSDCILMKKEPEKILLLFFSRLSV